jgi:hypothetical protein
MHFNDVALQRIMPSGNSLHLIGELLPKWGAVFQIGEEESQGIVGQIVTFYLATFESRKNRIYISVGVFNVESFRNVSILPIKHALQCNSSITLVQNLHAFWQLAVLS